MTDSRSPLSDDALASVRVATTGPIALSGLQTIDGVAVTAKQRVLVKDQASAAANGIYEVKSAAWARARDAREGDGHHDLTSGAHVFVSEGTVNAGKVYYLTTPDPIALGLTDQTWEEFVGAAGPAGADGAPGADGQDAGFVAADISVAAQVGSSRVVSVQLKDGEGANLTSARVLQGYLTSGGSPVYNTSGGAAIVTGTTLEGNQNPIRPQGLQPQAGAGDYGSYLWTVLTDADGLFEIEQYAGSGGTYDLHVILPSGEVASSGDFVLTP